VKGGHLVVGDDRGARVLPGVLQVAKALGGYSEVLSDIRDVWMIGDMRRWAFGLIWSCQGGEVTAKRWMRNRSGFPLEM